MSTSIVNADGDLTDPRKALLRTAKGLTNGSLAPDPEPDSWEQRERPVHAANGEPAGTAGGAPHRGPKGQQAARRHRGAGSGAAK